MTEESTALVPLGDPVVVAHPNNANQQQNQVEGAQQEQAPQHEDTWSLIKKMLYRMVIFYLITSLIRGWFQPQQSPPAGGDQANLSGGGPRSAGKPGRNMFQFGDELDFFVYISESDGKFQNFNDSSALFWHIANFKYGDWSSGDQFDGSYTKSDRIETTERLRNNGSLYMHVFVTKSGFHPDPTRKATHSKRFTFYKLHRLNKYKKKRYQKTQNLLTGKTEQSEEDAKKAETLTAEILSHWHPNLTVNLVTDQTAWVRGSIPPPLDDQIEFENYAGIDFYYPPIFFNDYWNLMADYQPINDTVKFLNFTLTISPISLFKWQIYAAQTMRNKWSAMFGSSGSTITSLFEDDQDDQDSLKQAMLDTNPYLLGLTIVVSILHTIFEFLAFKNDIQFWRNRKSLEGLSVRSVVFNLLTSIIVLLYILDNETNFVVRLSVGVGVLIDLWKIPKCMDVSLDRDQKWFGLIPRIRIKDKGSYVESSTKQYDILAFKYLSWALYPLLAGYAVYSLLYQEHRGWYSWVLSMLYGFLLTFGFIMMTPQLFINYKLKSVAHLPWRMLSYKFLNTFIDDIFAFVIKMPTMYRIGCFRDDIIFLIYLYQRWIYRVDPTRLNEFGTSGELEAEAAANRNRDNINPQIQQRQEDHEMTETNEDHVTSAGRPSNSPQSTNRHRRRRNEKSGGGSGDQSESASSSASANHELSASAAASGEESETKKDK